MARIVVADDDDAVRELIVRVLGDHVVLPARDGKEAIEIARREKPDLVILDIGMPGKDGVDACRDLKYDPELKSIPILMLTGKGKMAAMEESFEARADDYMQKPFTGRVLAARVEALLKK